MKYIVRGLSGSVTDDNGDAVPERIGHGVTLDGAENEFVQYMHNPALAAKLVSGYMRFEFDKEAQRLVTITEYTARERLTVAEKNALGKYTQGQWADGIGEGFEQFPCREYAGHDVLISPWYHGQVVTVDEAA